MNENIKFYTADMVAEMLSVSKTTAYRIIKTMNEELKKEGYFTINGKVPRKYFELKYYF